MKTPQIVFSIFMICISASVHSLHEVDDPLFTGEIARLFLAMEEPWFVQNEEGKVVQVIAGESALCGVHAAGVFKLLDLDSPRLIEQKFRQLGQANTKKVLYYYSSTFIPKIKSARVAHLLIQHGLDPKDCTFNRLQYILKNQNPIIYATLCKIFAVSCDDALTGFSLEQDFSTDIVAQALDELKQQNILVVEDLKKHRSKLQNGHNIFLPWEQRCARIGIFDKKIALLEQNKPFEIAQNNSDTQRETPEEQETSKHIRALLEDI